MRELRDNLPFTPVDIKDAGADYLAARLGVKNAARAHPSAERLADHEISLPEMAIVFGAREALRRQRNMSPVEAMSAGMETADFGGVLTDAIRQLVTIEYGTQDEHRKIAAPIPVRNFHEVDFPSFDLNANLPEIFENAEYRHISQIATSGGEAGVVKSYGAIVGISRKTIINDNVGSIETAFRQFAAAASRREAEETFSVLESNPTLSDGAAMFSETAGNLLVSSAFSRDNLGQAVGKLRRQSGAAGAATNNRPAYLVVPPEQEVNALAVVAELSNSGRYVEVIASAHIAATNWYVMAAPARSPVLGFLHLENARQTVRVEPVRKSIRWDGQRLKVATDFGVAALSRVGVIKAQEVA